MNREAFESWYKKVNCGFDDFSRHELGYYEDFDVRRDWDVWQAALASQSQQNHSEDALNMVQSQVQQPTNVWQQAIDDELVNAHLGVARNEVTREEAKAQLNKLIEWHIDVAKYFESQAQQTENLITRKAFICPACEGVDADSPVSSCHCMENDSNTFIEGTITYRLPPAPVSCNEQPMNEVNKHECNEKPEGEKT